MLLSSQAQLEAWIIHNLKLKLLLCKLQYQDQLLRLTFSPDNHNFTIPMSSREDLLYIQEFRAVIRAERTCFVRF